MFANRMFSMDMNESGKIVLKSTERMRILEEARTEHMEMSNTWVGNGFATRSARHFENPWEFSVFLENIIESKESTAARISLLNSAVVSNNGSLPTARIFLDTEGWTFHTILHVN